MDVGHTLHRQYLLVNTNVQGAKLPKQCTSVILFSKLNQLFLGYFDPVNNIFLDRNDRYSG